MQLKSRSRPDIGSEATTWEPSTPISRQFTPVEVPPDFDASFAIYVGELTPFPANVLKSLLSTVQSSHGTDVSMDPLSPTLVHSIEYMDTDLRSMSSTSAFSHQPIDSSAPSDSSDMCEISSQATIEPSSSTRLPTHDLSNSAIVDNSSPWTCTDNVFELFLQQKSSLADGLETLGSGEVLQSPVDHCRLNCATSFADHFSADSEMTVHDIQGKISELRPAHKIPASRQMYENGFIVDVVRRAMYKCDYTRCHKAFRRNDHLRRHKQTYVALHSQRVVQFDTNKTLDSTRKASTAFRASSAERTSSTEKTTSITTASGIRVPSATNVV